MCRSSKTKQRWVDSICSASPQTHVKVWLTLRTSLNCLSIVEYSFQDWEQDNGKALSQIIKFLDNDVWKEAERVVSKKPCMYLRKSGPFSTRLDIYYFCSWQLVKAHKCFRKLERPMKLLHGFISTIITWWKAVVNLHYLEAVYFEQTKTPSFQVESPTSRH